MKAFNRIALTTGAFLREVLGSSAPGGISPSPKLDGTGRLPIDMLVIDVSASMDMTDYPPSRLDGAKQAATRFLQKRFEVSPDALVGIVTFCSHAKLVSTPSSIRENLVQLQDQLQGLSTADATNASAGLSIAQKAILKARSAETRRIILLTDGYSNSGPDAVTTSEKIKEAGTQLDIIGIGGSPKEVNEKDLKRMASVVNGELRYWFIRSVGELVQRFETLALREIK